MSTATVKRNTIFAYGGLATPLAMIGYPIAIWLIPFYSEVVGIPLYIIANLLLIARFTDVVLIKLPRNNVFQGYIIVLSYLDNLFKPLITDSKPAMTVF